MGIPCRDSQTPQHGDGEVGKPYTGSALVVKNRSSVLRGIAPGIISMVVHDPVKDGGYGFVDCLKALGKLFGFGEDVLFVHRNVFFRIQKKFHLSGKLLGRKWKRSPGIQRLEVDFDHNPLAEFVFLKNFLGIGTVAVRRKEFYSQWVNDVIDDGMFTGENFGGCECRT